MDRCEEEFRACMTVLTASLAADGFETGGEWSSVVVAHRDTGAACISFGIRWGSWRRNRDKEKGILRRLPLQPYPADATVERGLRGGGD